MTPSWPTVALLGLVLAALCFCAYLDRASVTAIVGALGAIATAAAPRLLASKGTAS